MVHRPRPTICYPPVETGRWKAHTRDDYGVVAILDTRLLRSSYGRAIASFLPDMDIVHSIENVKRFFASIPQPASPEVQANAASQGQGMGPGNAEKV